MCGKFLAPAETATPRWFRIMKPHACFPLPPPMIEGASKGHRFALLIISFRPKHPKRSNESSTCSFSRNPHKKSRISFCDRRAAIAALCSSIIKQHHASGYRLHPVCYTSGTLCQHPAPRFYLPSHWQAIVRQAPRKHVKFVWATRLPNLFPGERSPHCRTMNSVPGAGAMCYAVMIIADFIGQLYSKCPLLIK